MLNLAATQGVKVDRLIGVYGGSRNYQFGEVAVWTFSEFVKALFSGGIF